ncbi:hypothetical protein [Alteromonas sp. S015]|uniref:hypothetical protein n=1 Tax=Alteromonas sp. S015 TaxID=3117401 RepID=UPI002FE1D6BD
MASMVNQPVSVFSTYPSDTLLKACESQRALSEVSAQQTANRCFEDAISPDRFIKILSESGEFSHLLPYGEGNDYELLIANVGAMPGEHQQHAKQFAEFTLQWRGIEIDSSSFNADVVGNADVKTETGIVEEEAQSLITHWLLHAKHAGLFTSQFLFNALEASDYEVGLQVPNAVGKFTKLDTQLYADPFNGAITRYVHPEFEDALVDVIVYPFLDQLSSSESELLPRQLQNDLQKASATADLQHLTLSQLSPASRYEVNSSLKGWRLGLSAVSETSPTIYATTYVFRLQDKIVKVSTTFPPDFSDSIVNQLIVNVQVPQESEMMKKVRSLLLNSPR